MNITNIYADPDCPDCNGTGERDSGGTHPWGEPIYLACDCVDAQIGKRWRTNSSLENWFPLTAEKLGQISSDLEDAQGEIRALRATEAGLIERVKVLEEGLKSCHGSLKFLGDASDGDVSPKAWRKSGAEASELQALNLLLQNRALLEKKE